MKRRRNERREGEGKKEGSEYRMEGEQQRNGVKKERGGGGTGGGGESVCVCVGGGGLRVCMKSTRQDPTLFLLSVLHGFVPQDQCGQSGVHLALANGQRNPDIAR